MGDDKKHCCGGGFGKFVLGLLVLAGLAVGGSAAYDVYQGKPAFSTLKGLKGMAQPQK